MSEDDWLNAGEPDLMLTWLRDFGGASERKLRLFAVACFRRVWHLLTDEHARAAVRTSERYADGAASLEELEAAFAAADRAHQEACQRASVQSVTFLDAARLAAHPVERGLADSTAHAVAFGVAWQGNDFVEAAAGEESHQCDLLRDVFGLLAFRPVPVPGSWRTRTVLALAQRAYEEQDPRTGMLDAVALGVMADALEEAGCDGGDLLTHLRQPGIVHVRGCWAVDLLPEKS
jgi:hypothetical protein